MIPVLLRCDVLWPKSSMDLSMGTGLFLPSTDLLQQWRWAALKMGAPSWRCAPVEGRYRVIKSGFLIAKKPRPTNKSGLFWAKNTTNQRHRVIVSTTGLFLTRFYGTPLHRVFSPNHLVFFPKAFSISSKSLFCQNSHASTRILVNMPAKSTFSLINLSKWVSDSKKCWVFWLKHWEDSDTLSFLLISLLYYWNSIKSHVRGNEGLYIWLLFTLSS